MATTTIPWGDGSGDNIYLTYSSASEGDQKVQVSSDANTGAARSKVVTFTSGVGNIQRQLTINQAAGRQEHTITLHPTSYDTENHSWRTYSNISRGYTNSSSTTYARFGIPYQGGAAYIYYKFDTSAIPDGAEIVSVSCKAKATASGNSTTTPVKQIQMATGTTLKGSPTTIPSSASSAERDIADVGTWTLEELRDIRIRPYARTGSNITAGYNLDFYGATLTITYIA